jgi:hypothetical protein
LVTDCAPRPPVVPLGDGAAAALLAGGLVELELERYREGSDPGISGFSMSTQFRFLLGYLLFSSHLERWR